MISKSAVGRYGRPAGEGRLRRAWDAGEDSDSLPDLGTEMAAVPDHLAFEAAIASLTAARDQAEKRTDQAQQRADQAEAHADELREKLDKLLHDQKAADAIAVEVLMKSEEQRQAEIARKARGLVARLRAALRRE